MKINIINAKYFLLAFIISIIYVAGDALPISSTNLLVVFLMFVLLGRLVKKDLNLTFDYSDLFFVFWIWCIIVLVLIGTINAIDVSLVFSYVNFYIFGLVIFFTVKFIINNKESYSILLKVLGVSIGLISLITIFAHLLFVITGIQSELLLIRHSGARGTGFMDNPNYYAITLIIGLGSLMGIRYFKLSNSKTFNNLNFILITVIVIGIFFTFSRGAWIACFGMLLFYLSSRIKSLITIKNISYSIILIIPILILLQQVNLSSIFVQAEAGVEDLLYGSGSGRYDLWKNGWLLFTENLTNILIGVGGNQFQFFTEYGITNHVHNSYLRYLYETGVLGFFMLILLLVFITLQVFDIKKIRPKSPTFFAMVGLLLMGFSNDILMLKEFWLIVTLTIVWNSINSTRSKESTMAVESR